MTAGEPEPKGGGRELDRIIFFSDAVFAIAITLLVLDIKPPVIPKEYVAGRLGSELWALRSGYFSYVLSFLVIGAFWAAHHRIFRYITGYDGPLILQSLREDQVAGSLAFLREKLAATRGE